MAFLMVLQFIVVSIILLFISGVTIKRCEKYTREFYLPLRENYPRSYVRQNKIVKFVRKLYKMNTTSSVHWIYCFCHYLQAIVLGSPILILLLLLFVPFKKAVMICAVISLGHYGLISVLTKTLLCIEELRCKKIKKTDPEYSKREFYEWFG